MIAITQFGIFPTKGHKIGLIRYRFLEFTI